MEKKTLYENVLLRALKNGGDFAELYVNHTKYNGMHLIDSGIDTVSDSLVVGAGLRVLLGTKCVSASTADLSEEGLLRCADAIADMMSQKPSLPSIHLKLSSVTDLHAPKLTPEAVSKGQRAELLLRADRAARESSAFVAQVTGNLSDVDHRITVANSDGLWKEDRQVRTRLAISAVAENGADRRDGFYGPGLRMGFELFSDVVSPETVAEEAARSACSKLGAEPCPAGKMTVAIDGGFGGVIFHEACGHSLEATSVSRGTSQMCGKLGQQVANCKLTAIDDGTIPHAWGSINIDDEGTPAQRNVLIENGILKGYMIDKLGGRRMGMAPTGSSRRQNFEFEPTSRMTNTFIAPGKDHREDIITSIEYGLYCRKMGGGSVNPINGAFNFAVDEGYMVRNGKICEAVTGASLIGTGSEVLMNIDMIADEVVRAPGMCGSSSGSIPTEVGQPMIRVSDITVGGRK
ncbi:MAG: TldD/PmbA family protein [Ruminococcaceae bacterium]|nr:TldD/PmbA family protein [Oscillospiraceae bacterium]